MNDLDLCKEGEVSDESRDVWRHKELGRESDKNPCVKWERKSSSDD